ncbi:MAG: DUF4298 domain-containing protein [Tissierellia bacterium]|nr:DUF4298 domain-containing protein [Tissierellia bacterium]
MQKDKLEKLTKIYNNHNNTIDDLLLSLKAYKKSYKSYKELISYYYSEDFYQDMVDSNEGKIDKSIDQTILSEDAIYDLLAKNIDISLELLATANSILQDRDI